MILKKTILLLCFLSTYSVFANDLIQVKKNKGHYSFYSDDLGTFYSFGINAFFRKWDNDPMKEIFAEKDKLKKLHKNELQRLRELGFNTLGGWSSQKFSTEDFAYGKVLFDFEEDVPFGSPLLDIRGREIGLSPVNGKLKVPLSDPYDKKYQVAVDNYIKNNVVRSKDRHFLCYWLGNEFGFGDTEAHDFSNHLNSKDVQGVYVAWLKKKYKKMKILNHVWDSKYTSFQKAALSQSKINIKEKQARIDFSVKVLHDWFSLVVTAIKKYDPNHLICSPRMNSWAMAWAEDEDQYLSKAMRLKQFSALKGLVDVLSFNIYSKQEVYPEAMFDQLEEISKKLNVPILITEFGTREKIKGWNHKPGAKTLVKDQATRARFYQTQVKQFLSKPYIVGAHWFKWANHNSKKHQFNKGIVYVKDKKIYSYKELTQSMRKTHQQLN